MKVKRQRRHGTRIRESYGTAINQRIPFDYDIHHIDHAHTNNDFKNLVAIPKELHRRYHSAFDLCRNQGFAIGQILRAIKTGSNQFKNLQSLYNEIMDLKKSQIVITYAQ